MLSKTSIEWTEYSWNPVTGCNKISPGCQHCYADRMSKRLKAMRNPNYVNGFDLTIHEHMLEIPLHIKKPSIIFVNSMSDLFHKDVPLSFIKDVFAVMNKANHHIYQVLTKRSERLLKLNSKLTWNENIWMGVSVENNDYTYRIHDLVQTDAFVKFISFEPLLGPVYKLNLKGIDWVIVGGESGPGARKLDIEWVRPVRDYCIKKSIPFFFKQWGGTNKKKNGRLLDGKIWSGFPQR